MMSQIRWSSLMYEIRASRDIKKDNTQAPAMHGLIMKGLHHRAAQRIIGREGETAPFLSRCPSNLNLRVFGFAPRQFNRSASFLEMEAAI